MNTKAADDFLPPVVGHAHGGRLYRTIDRRTTPGFLRGLFESDPALRKRFEAYAERHGFAIIGGPCGVLANERRPDRMQVYVPSGDYPASYNTLVAARTALLAKIDPLLAVLR
jgi:hypothetical protein